MFLRDLDLLIGALDQRRIEVIAEGLRVFHGAQLAIDAPFGHSVQVMSHTGAVLKWTVLL